jgi:hypothetical protein
MSAVQFAVNGRPVLDCEQSHTTQHEAKPNAPDASPSQLLNTQPHVSVIPGNNCEAFTNYHCCAEWHLARLHSPTAALVYPFALRLSKTSRKFACSAVSVGEFFGLDRKTILRAYRQLTDKGFFELVESGAFDVNIYRVLLHKEWAAKYPGQCAKKIEFPWAGEGDLLGRRLYAASGGKVKFKPFQIVGYRNTGLKEDKIVALFEEFLPESGRFRSKNVGFQFLKYLKEHSLNQAPQQEVFQKQQQSS